uniref:Zona pellucida sperm-binding protein 3 n=1 Tax=Stegastes partitus TaxID=144197 RepID=A0A3B4ZQ39_9TELE
MQTAGGSVFLALLMSVAFGAAEAIRTLKEGPMIDAEGREYKSAPLRTDPWTADSAVRVRCTDASMIVVVKADLYHNGRLVSPGELFLGQSERSGSRRCRAAAASGAGEYVIEADLQDCGAKLSISEDSVIYSNVLTFSPAVGRHGITRTTHAAVPVSCHYKSAQQQQQPLTVSTKDSAGSSAFSLRLMADDWTSELFSNSFYLGDVLHLEASYAGPGRRRLYIDSCVATLTPDAASVPRYYFIGNNGCLTDAKEEASKALFRPRLRAEVLQLQLDTFLFQKHSRNSVSCPKSASFNLFGNASRWRNVDGDDAACRCCDSSCHTRPPTRKYNDNRSFATFISSHWIHKETNCLVTKMKN